MVWGTDRGPLGSQQRGVEHPIFSNSEGRKTEQRTNKEMEIHRQEGGRRPREGPLPPPPSACCLYPCFACLPWRHPSSFLLSVNLNRSSSSLYSPSSYVSLSFQASILCISILTEPLLLPLKLSQEPSPRIAGPMLVSPKSLWLLPACNPGRVRGVCTAAARYIYICGFSLFFEFFQCA